MLESVPPLGLSCPPSLCEGIGTHLFGEWAKQSAVSDAEAVLQAFASGVLAAATWLVDATVKFLNQVTKADLGAGWFKGRFRAMERVALLVVAPMVLAATIGAVIRQDTKRLARIYFVGIPLAGTATVCALALVSEAVSVVDELCRTISWNHSFTPFTMIGGDLNHGHVPIVVAILVGSVVLVAGLLLWLELILRSIVIDITVFFLPLALAAIVWPATTQIARRFLEVLLAVIGSKFVIVATLTLADRMAYHAGTTPADGVKASAVLLLAAFAPLALLRLVPLLEVAAIAHMEGMSRRAVRGAARAASASAGGAKSAAGLLLSRAGSEVEGSSVGATDIPWREGDLRLDDLPGGSSSSPPSPGGQAPGGQSPGDSVSAASSWSGGASSISGRPPGGDSPAADASPSGGDDRASAGSRSASSVPAPSAVALADSPDSAGTTGDTSRWLVNEDADLPDPSDLPGPLPVLGPVSSEPDDPGDG